MASKKTGEVGSVAGSTIRFLKEQAGTTSDQQEESGAPQIGASRSEEMPSAQGGTVDWINRGRKKPRALRPTGKPGKPAELSPEAE